MNSNFRIKKYFLIRQKKQKKSLRSFIDDIIQNNHFSSFKYLCNLNRYVLVETCHFEKSEIKIKYLNS